MAKAPLRYITKNNLESRIKDIQRQHSIKFRGESITIDDIILDIADFCGVSFHTIDKIKRGINTPSLPVALRIAEFFNAKVEEVFTNHQVTCPVCMTPWNGKEWKVVGKSKAKLVCQNCGNEFSV